MRSITKSIFPYKYIIAIVLMVILWTSNVWAQSPETLCPTDTTEQVTSLLNIILTFLSWIWIVLATLAGKLMTNGFVYGEFMNLDKVLYYLWNMSRTFANFLIVWLLLYTIISKALKGPLNGGEIVEFIVKKLILWVILINASWFIIGAMVDISTIVTSAAASLPSSYVASNGQNMRDTITQSLQIHGPSKKITYNLWTSICSSLKAAETSPSWNNNTSQNTDINALLDMVLPNETSVSWPLLYLWVSVFQIQNFLNNTNDPKAIIDNLFVVGVRLAITLMFTFALILLIIVNIFRLVTIWFAVAFGPILILLTLNSQEKLLWSLWEKFSIESITKAIFAPVIAVAMLSLWLIVIVIMQKFLQLNTNIEWWDAYVSSSAQWSRIGVTNIFDTMIAGDILWEENQTGAMIKNTFSNILLIIFTLFILYGITQLLTKFLAKWFGAETVKSIADLWGKALWSIPMIPTSQWAISIGWAMKWLERMTDDFKGKLSLSSRDSDEALENKFREMMGMEVKIPYNDLKALKQITKDLSKKENITTSTYNKINKEISKIIGKGKYTTKSIPISKMEQIPDTIQALFKGMAENNITPRDLLWSEYSNNKLEWRVDWWPIQEFIEKNYKNNKKFFNKIYSDIGGDADYISTRNGKWFWNEKVKWAISSSPQITPSPTTAPPTP